VENTRKSKVSILRKTGQLARKYEKQYKGCAQCTFLAAVDALRWGGIEIVPVSLEEKLYPALSMLTAGCCMTGEGTCGAAASSLMVLGLNSKVSMDNPEVAVLREAAEITRHKILSVYFKKYHSIICKDIQRKYFGKAWDMTDDKMAHEFLGLTKGCIISEAALLTVKCILEEY
jgi:hypothetical protein